MPGDALTVVSTSDGARKRFGWAELVSYERDGVKIDVLIGAAVAPTTAIEVNQGPPVDLVVMEAGEHFS